MIECPKVFLAKFSFSSAEEFGLYARTTQARDSVTRLSNTDPPIQYTIYQTVLTGCVDSCISFSGSSRLGSPPPMSSQEEEAVASELAALLRQVGEGAATEEEDSGTQDMGCSAEFNMPEKAISYSRDTEGVKGTSSPSVIGTRSFEGEEGDRVPQIDRDVVTFTQVVTSLQA